MKKDRSLKKEISNPLVSICIPTYNNGQYIGETLDSLINQTYNNIEIIVSDNASTDNTKEVVKSKQKLDKRIRYYRNDRNLGYVKNINNTVEKANSDIIAIFHSDDVYERTIIEKELSKLLVTSEVGAVFSLLSIFYEEKLSKKYLPKMYKHLQSYKIYNKDMNMFIGGIVDYLPVITKYGNIFTCPSLLCYKKVYLDIGGYRDTYPSNEDFDFWLRIMNAGYQIVMINEYLLNYRISTKQGSQKYKNLPMLPKVYEVLIKFRKENKHYFSDNKLNRSMDSFVSRGYCRAALNSFKNKEYKKALVFIKRSKEYYSWRIFTKNGLCQRLLYSIACFLDDIHT